MKDKPKGDETDPKKCCRVCGHPKAWHKAQCYGPMNYKGGCSANCQKFKPVKESLPHA